MSARRLWLLLGAFVITLGASPVTGWAARAVGTVVTGPITASPSSTQIEVAHHVYSIEANSPAAANARSFFLGQVVDLVLTRGSASGAPEVISITAHKDS